MIDGPDALRYRALACAFVAVVAPWWSCAPVERHSALEASVSVAAYAAAPVPANARGELDALVRLRLEERVRCTLVDLGQDPNRAGAIVRDLESRHLAALGPVVVGAGKDDGVAAFLFVLGLICLIPPLTPLGLILLLCALLAAAGGGSGRQAQAQPPPVAPLSSPSPPVTPVPAPVPDPPVPPRQAPATDPLEDFESIAGVWVQRRTGLRAGSLVVEGRIRPTETIADWEAWTGVRWNRQHPERNLEVAVRTLHRAREPERPVPAEPWIADGVYDSTHSAAWDGPEVPLCDGRYNTFYRAMMRGAFGSGWARSRVSGELDERRERAVVESDVLGLSELASDACHPICDARRRVVLRWKHGRRGGELEARIETLR